MSELDFITGCPISGCDNARSKLAWTHDNCGSKEKINDQGIVRCIKCGNLGEFFLLKYKCSRHNGFQYGNYSAFSAALSVLAEYEPDFSSKLTDKLLDAWKNKRLPGQK
jgi:hypothetical protein